MLKDVKVLEDDGHFYFVGEELSRRKVTFAVLDPNGVLLLIGGCPADCGLSITDIDQESSLGRVQVCKPDGTYI